MDRTDWDYIKSAFSLTPKERSVVIVAAVVLAVGAAVKYWRESRAVPEPVSAAQQQEQIAAKAKSN